jgi:hypothetical protein
MGYLSMMVFCAGSAVVSSSPGIGSTAARRLGITRVTLRAKLRRYGLAQSTRRAASSGQAAVK